MLAIAVGSEERIHEVQGLNFQIKLSLYADDVVFYLQNLIRSLTFLNVLISGFAAASGFKVNEKKSVIMGLNLKKLKAQLKTEEV